MRIKVDTSVTVAEDVPGYLAMFRGRNGKVIRVYDDLIIPVAIVQFSENVTAKVPITCLIEVKEQANEPDPKIPAKRITRDDFAQAIADATCPKLTGKTSDLIGLMSASIVGMDIANNLFKDRDAVVMTEDQLVETLWDGCNPKNVSETVNGEMNFTQSMSVSIASIITLREIVKILFPEDDK